MKNLYVFFSDFLLFIRLWLNGISLRSSSLRKFSLKRVFVILIVLPLIVIHILLSHVCLLLDHLLFPSFKNKPITNPVFIVGFPRTGTSFLLNLLAHNEQKFTAFRLWEMVFAPSILQKRIFIQVGKVLGKIVSIKKFATQMDNLLFYKMKDIHKIEFAAFEEDEMLFVYNFQSAYFAFIFPELEDIHKLLTPDNKDNLQKRIAGQYFYKSMIKRHLYVFNEDNSKTFLSKNPFHPLRMESLTTAFPNGKYLFNERPLLKILPSTLSLNITLFQYFCNMKDENPLRQKSIENLLEWHLTLSELKKNQQWEELYIDFKNMVAQPSNEAARIHDWLGISLNDDYKMYLTERDEFSKNYKSKHTYPALTKEEIYQVNKVINAL